MDPSLAGKASRAKNCQECRRLKIKCDRTVPCNNCVKRGTASICPDGTLLPKSHRIILSASEELPARIESLTRRVQELEEALAKLQAAHSDEPHPLLRPAGYDQGHKEEDEVQLANLGALMIGENGNSRYFGATGSVEWVCTPMPSYRSLEPVSTLQVLMGMHERDHSSPGSMPEPTSNPFQPTLESTTPLFTQPLSAAALIDSEFPLPVSSNQLDFIELRKRVILSLPEKALAERCIETYYGRAAWEFNPVPRSRFIKDIFIPTYGNVDPPVSAHELALLYALLAIGMLFNFEYPSFELLANNYISLSRACLNLDNPIVSTSVTTVEVYLLHTAFYYSSTTPSPHVSSQQEADREVLYNPSRAWVTLGVAIKLAQSIGLHREPTLWDLPPEEVQRRRRTMWELVTVDMWASLIGGRPPMMSKNHFDVKIPFLEEVDGKYHVVSTGLDPSDPDPTFIVGKFHFNEHCLWPVLEVGLATTSKLTYAAVLKIDLRVRTWKLPTELVLARREPAEEHKTIIAFRRTTAQIVREVTLMCLHRCYFASALVSPTFDILKSPCAKSVLAAYASACSILSNVRALYATEPVTIMRSPFFWTHSFGAAVILGAIVARAPDCSLAMTASTEFDLGVELFKKASGNHRARRGLPTLLRLQATANEAMLAYKNGTWSRDSAADSPLLRDMGGAGAVLHHERTPSPPITSSSSSAPSFAAGGSASLEDYLSSLQYNNATGGGEAFGASNTDFMQGMLTGDWNNLLPSNSGASPTSQPDTSSRPSTSRGMGRGYSILGMNPAISAPSPFSDGSSNAPGIEETRGFRAAAGSTHWDATGVQRSFLWDNLLQQLGVNSL